mgnify:CR=1 FL=1
MCIQSLRFHTERKGTTAKKQTKFQVVNRQIAGKFYPCFKTMPRFPAQMGGYPCFKLHKRKRLNNIIITTSGKSFYFIGVFNSGSQKKDRLVTIHCFMLFLVSFVDMSVFKSCKSIYLKYWDKRYKRLFILHFYCIINPKYNFYLIISIRKSFIWKKEEQKNTIQILYAL